MSGGQRIFVLVEHRIGELRDITWEMLTKGRNLVSQSGGVLSAILLGQQVGNLAQELAKRTDEVLVVEDEKLRYFNSETYQEVLVNLINQYKPTLTLIGHTGFGMDLAPSLATQLGISLTTDCIDLNFEDGKLVAVRQMYGGKVNAEVTFAEASTYLITMRAGSFPAEGEEIEKAEIENLNYPLKEAEYKRFVEYVEAAVGEVDITKADFIISVGQGIGDSKNIPMVAELADIMGGILACSRPIVDKKWLPKDRQVGTSGKTVKPKVYLAIGISGAFQHISGIKGSTIIAINKDSKAPIFRVADYGIVGDLLKIVPVLTAGLRELKAS